MDLNEPRRRAADVEHPRRRAADVELERERIHRRIEIALPLRLRRLWRRQVYVQVLLLGFAIMLLPRETPADVLRAVFLASAVFYLLMAAAVTRVYWETQRVVAGRAELLPRHVRWVAIGDATKTIGVLILVVTLAGQEPVLHGIPLALASVGVTAQSIALGVMWRFQIVRIHGDRLREN